MFLDTSFLKSDELWLRLERTVEGDPARDWVPAYHFSICDLQGERMGRCELRAERGKTETCIYRFVLNERSLDQ